MGFSAFARYLPLMMIAAGCSSSLSRPIHPADTIYFNGDIVTLEDGLEAPQALAVRDGSIVAVGAEKDILRWRDSKTEMRDLRGRTLSPGFVDAHSHIGDYTQMLGRPNLSPPPGGTVRRIEDIIEVMRKDLAKRKPGETLYGVGYDDSLLEERRHPTAKELDRIAADRPVFILHASGHLAVGNSLILRKAGLVKGAKDPAGGHVVRDPKTGVPTGLVEEQAVFAFARFVPVPSLSENLRLFDEVQDFYASQGITTAQDGLTMPSTLSLLREAARRKRLKIDIVSYPKYSEYEAMTRGLETGVYDNRLKIGGMKIIEDGSPQGRTAFLSKPYLTPPPGKPASYRGEPILPQEELDRWIEFAARRNVQPLVHCNGDAAADMMIAAVAKARDKLGAKDWRPVMIHAQTVREDQLDRMVELKILPSFFGAHPFYWGDWYREVVLGPERAARISPMASALRRGLIFSNHTDAPVVPPDELALVDIAVNRKTRSGFVLGPEQRIGAKDALKAVTLGGAFQYFEEDRKGSLAPGKVADLVILSANPLRVPPEELGRIRVLETIKDGETIYRAEDR